MPVVKGMTEDERLRFVTELMLAIHMGRGNTPEVSRSKILAAVGSLFDGSFRRRKQVEYFEIEGQMEPCVSTEGAFLIVAGEHKVNLFAPATQARWSCIVRGELDRLLALAAQGVRPWERRDA